MTRMDDLGEEFTIKFVDAFCNVERSVGDTAASVLLSSLQLLVGYRKFDFGWGSAPDPAGGAYSAPPVP